LKRKGRINNHPIEKRRFPVKRMVEGRLSRQSRSTIEMSLTDKPVRTEEDRIVQWKLEMMDHLEDIKTALYGKRITKSDIPKIEPLIMDLIEKLDA
jgi:hypothetical protein